MNKSSLCSLVLVALLASSEARPFAPDESERFGCTITKDPVEFTARSLPDPTDFLDEDKRGSRFSNEVDHRPGGYELGIDLKTTSGWQANYSAKHEVVGSAVANQAVTISQSRTAEGTHTGAGLYIYQCSMKVETDVFKGSDYFLTMIRQKNGGNHTLHLGLKVTSDTFQSDSFFLGTVRVKGAVIAAVVGKEPSLTTRLRMTLLSCMVKLVM